MDPTEPAHHPSESRTLPWVPLLVAALSSYGPVGNNYGFALYFLDWRHGFVKRGLVGELFSSARLLTGAELRVIEYAFLALGFGLTYVILRPVLFGSAAERRLAAVLLSAPALLPHLGYMFAQPDIMLYILVLGCVAAFLSASPLRAAAVSAPLCILGMLTHEAFSLMFYPLVLALLVHACSKGRLRWWIPAARLLLMVGAFASIVHWGNLKIPPAEMLREAESRTDVPVRPQVYQVMASSFSDQRALVRRMYSPYVLHVLLLTLALSAPYFTLLARLLQGILDAESSPRWQRLVTAGLFLSPLLLCTIGHDTTRWIRAMCLDVTLFLVYGYLSDRPHGPVRTYLTSWAARPEVVAWLAYFVAIGPYGATGLRTAEQLIGASFPP